MKKSEVIKELLESYYFQNGKRANKRVTEKARKIIKTFEKEEIGMDYCPCGDECKLRSIIK